MHLLSHEDKNANIFGQKLIDRVGISVRAPNDTQTTEAKTLQYTHDLSYVIFRSKRGINS